MIMPARSTTSFDRALSLLDDPPRSQSRRSRPIGSGNDSPNPTASFGSPPRRRNRTAQTSPSASGSPLKDYLKRHSVELNDPRAERMTSPQASSSVGRDPWGPSPRPESVKNLLSPSSTGEPPQTFTRDPFLDDQTIEAATQPASTASLYVSPRRPLRSSIFESSPRNPTTSTTLPAIIRQQARSSERPRQTSATLRYALQQTTRTQSRDEAKVTDDSDYDEQLERDPSGHNTSFLDAESDPPTDLDERFPAIDPAPTPRPRASADGVTEAPRTPVEADMWRETQSDYCLPRAAPSLTPPELAIVKGIDVEQLRTYVQSRVPDDGETGAEFAPAEHSAPLGWVSSRGPLNGIDMPLCRRDLGDSVQGLKDEMRTMRVEIQRMARAVGVDLVEVAEAPAMPSHVSTVLSTIDALVHHTLPGSRSVNQVMAPDNLDEVVRRVRDWEAVVRSRGSTAYPVPVSDPDTITGLASNNG